MSPSRPRAPDLECITLQLSLSPSIKGIFFFCYRPPSQCPKNFFGALSTLLSAAEHESNCIFLVGDFNAKHNSWDASAVTNSAGTRLYNLALEFALTQCVTDHARFSADGQHRNILDLLLTNRPDLLLENNVTAPISDHCCVTSKFRTLQLESKTKTTTIILPDYKRADWDGLRTALYRTPLLEAIQGTENVNIAWEVWQQLFSTAVHQYIPTRHIRIRNRNKVWMTATLHHLSRQKHRLFRAAKRSGSPADWTKFKQKRNECNAAFQKAKINYKNQLSAQLDQEPLGSHQWWTKAKKISNISSPKTPIPDIEEGSTLATTDDDKAEVLANFLLHNALPKPLPLSKAQEHPTPFPITTRNSPFLRSVSKKC